MKYLTQDKTVLEGETFPDIIVAFRKGLSFPANQTTLEFMVSFAERHFKANGSKIRTLSYGAFLADLVSNNYLTKA
ncbi:MAG: hypothetical protein ACOVOW_05560 [Spirosomataceae bacterium]|jgi:hypothetical protein